MKNYLIEKQLCADNGKIFPIGSDIAFSILNPITNCYDHYIGTLKDITLDKKICLSNVEVNRGYSGNIMIDLDDIADNSCNYVSK